MTLQPSLLPESPLPTGTVKYRRTGNKTHKPFKPELEPVSERAKAVISETVEIALNVDKHYRQRNDKRVRKNNDMVKLAMNLQAILSNLIVESLKPDVTGQVRIYRSGQKKESLQSGLVFSHYDKHGHGAVRTP